MCHARWISLWITLCISCSKMRWNAAADEHYRMRVHAGWRVSVTLRVLYRGPSTCPSENSGARLNCGWI